MSISSTRITGNEIKAFNNGKRSRILAYGICGQGIMVMVGGVDVETLYKFPEDHLIDPVKFTDPDYTRSLLQELFGKIEVKKLAANFLIIDYGSGKYSIDSI